MGNLRLRLSPVTIMVQTWGSPSRSRAQRENQSRSPMDQATPSLAQSPPLSSLCSLPSPSKPPPPNITNIVQPILSPHVSHLAPSYPFAPLPSHSNSSPPYPPQPAPDHH